MNALLILSGGVDSTTLLYYLLDQKYQMNCLTFDYGQKHSKEMDNIPDILEQAETKYDQLINWEIIDLTSFSSLLTGKSSLLCPDYGVPECHYTENSAKSTVVAGRNLIMLSIAAGIAEANQIPKLFYAAHSGDWVIYPDCRESFINAAKTVISESSAWSPVELLAPFSSLSKADIVKIGIQLKVPYELTWSCYNGREKSCGKCPTCIERMEAFELNKINDPIEYERLY